MYVDIDKTLTQGIMGSSSTQVILLMVIVPMNN